MYFQCPRCSRTVDMARTGSQHRARTHAPCGIFRISLLGTNLSKGEG